MLTPISPFPKKKVPIRPRRGKPLAPSQGHVRFFPPLRRIVPRRLRQNRRRHDRHALDPALTDLRQDGSFGLLRCLRPVFWRHLRRLQYPRHRSRALVLRRRQK